MISSFNLFAGTRFGGAKRLYLFARELQKNSDEFTLVYLDSCFEKASEETGKEFKGSISIDFRYRTHRNLNFLYPIISVLFKRDQIDYARKLLIAKKFDVILVSFPLALELFRTLDLKGSKLVYLEDDLALDTMKKNETGVRGIKRIWKRFRYFQLYGHMKKILMPFSAFLAITQQEKHEIERLFPWLDCRIIKYGINPSEYTTLPFKSSLFSLGFIGNYNHPPNLAGIQNFVHSFLPSLLEKYPDLHLHVAGKNANLTGLTDNKNMTIHGEVQELKTFYDEITFFINPIISGWGLRTKLVEAAAFGRPIISTRLGAEGLEDLEMSIAETVQDYLSIFNSVKTGRLDIVKMAEHNRRMVELRYTIEEQGRNLLSILSE